MAWDFRVGQRVVCVCDNWQIAQCSNGKFVRHPEQPKRGDIFTITDLRFHQAGSRIGLLVVIRDASFVTLSGFDPARFFLCDHFRPLDERRLDPFRAHLAPAPRQLEAA